MSSEEELKNQLSNYEESLSTVKQALIADPSNKELAALVQDLNEAIRLTKSLLTPKSNPNTTTTSSSTSTSQKEIYKRKHEVLEEEQEEEEEEEEGYESEDIFHDPDAIKEKKKKKKLQEHNKTTEKKVQTEPSVETEKLTLPPSSTLPTSSFRTVYINGTDVPPEIDSFSDVDLPSQLKTNLTHNQFHQPTQIQRISIPILTRRRDLLATAPTGCGKTVAFLVPIISLLSLMKLKRPLTYYTCYPHSLILTPTRELSLQIFQQLEKLLFRIPLKPGVLYGGSSVEEQAHNLPNDIDILIATPGRLKTMIEKNKVSLSHVQYVCIDEVDRMLDMGFEKVIRFILQQTDLPSCKERQTAMFSATLPKQIETLASEFLNQFIYLKVAQVDRDGNYHEYDDDENKSSSNKKGKGRGTSGAGGGGGGGGGNNSKNSSFNLEKSLASVPSTIKHIIRFSTDTDKPSKLLHELRDSPKHQLILVFVETKKTAAEICTFLENKGLKVSSIHGDKNQREREAALSSFRNGTTNILIATDVASRGLDIPGCEHVINFDLPLNIEDYIHRVGRTGRNGQSGLATSYFNYTNKKIAPYLLQMLQTLEQQVPSFLLNMRTMASIPK